MVSLYRAAVKDLHGSEGTKGSFVSDYLFLTARVSSSIFQGGLLSTAF
jgi:hypothetical protein